MTLCSPSLPHLRNFEKRTWAVFSDGDIPPEREAHAALQSSSYPANPHNSPEEPAKVALFGIKRLTRTSDKPNGGNPYDHTAQPGKLEFHGLVQRKVKDRFDGGKITYDAGVLLLRKWKSGSDCWRD